MDDFGRERERKKESTTFRFTQRLNLNRHYTRRSFSDSKKIQSEVVSLFVSNPVKLLLAFDNETRCAIWKRHGSFINVYIWRTLRDDWRSRGIHLITLSNLLENVQRIFISQRQINSYVWSFSLLNKSILHILTREINNGVFWHCFDIHL